MILIEVHSTAVEAICVSLQKKRKEAFFICAFYPFINVECGQLKRAGANVLHKCKRYILYIHAILYLLKEIQLRRIIYYENHCNF